MHYDCCATIQDLDSLLDKRSSTTVVTPQPPIVQERRTETDRAGGFQKMVRKAVLYVYNGSGRVVPAFRRT